MLDEKTKLMLEVANQLTADDIELVNTVDDPDPPPAPGSTPIEIDGSFADWIGKANIADPSADQSGSSRHDIAILYWANNIDEGVNYHMIERHTTDGLPFLPSREISVSLLSMNNVPVVIEPVQDANWLAVAWIP